MNSILARITIPGLGPVGAEHTRARAVDSNGRERYVRLSAPVPPGQWYWFDPDGGEPQAASRSESLRAEQDMVQNAREMVMLGQTLNLCREEDGDQ